MEALANQPHWTYPYLSKGYDAEGLGPDAYSCWGLLLEVQRTHYGIEIPNVWHIEDPRARQRAFLREIRKWEVKPPTYMKDGCPVFMGRGSEMHVGCWVAFTDPINPIMMFHSLEKFGPCLSTPLELKLLGLTPRNTWIKK